MGSTEVLELALAQAWREVHPLPSPRCCLAGAPLGSIFHVSGGYGLEYYASVLSWDPISETWSESGRLLATRSYHAAIEAPSQIVTQFCRAG